MNHLKPEQYLYLYAFLCFHIVEFEYACNQNHDNVYKSQFIRYSKLHFDQFSTRVITYWKGTRLKVVDQILNHDTYRNNVKLYFNFSH